MKSIAIDTATYQQLSEALSQIKGQWCDTGLSEDDQMMMGCLNYRPVNYNHHPLVTTRGPLVAMADREYNNGIYLLQKEGDTALLQVLRPNTKDKSPLITQVIEQLDNAFAQIDVSQLEIYDLTQVYAHVLANQVVKPLAKQFYPHEKTQQMKYVHLYFSRFLANVARYYAGDIALAEEAVNSEPYLVKTLLNTSKGKDTNHESIHQVTQEDQGNGGKRAK